MSADDSARDVDRVEAVIDFWFGPMKDGLCSAEQRRAWFRADPAFDARIRERFGADIDDALAGHLDRWSMIARGRLALVVLLDQFTRNVHRGTARAWSGDAAAMELAREGVSRGDDRLLPAEQRLVLYLPFEHSESLADQNTCVHLVERLLGDQDPASEAAAVFEAYLRHARAHQELIQRFGRFPHRNAALDRESTPQERAWLAQDGRSFGQ
ncbi:MAG TPA: DUF924 family protein [Pseudomonadales bacterium]|nr:DUF924 family protein [Pseudomonadales bacterium]